MENRLRTKKKAKTTQKYKNKSLNEEYPFHTAEYNFCPPCGIEVLDNKEGVRCNSLCNTWFHLECIGMPSVQYMVISQDPNYGTVKNAKTTTTAIKALTTILISHQLTPGN